MPDIPLEETGEIREAASSAGLELVLLTTPTTPRERMQAIAKASQGFVYLVSVTGVRDPDFAVHLAIAFTTIILLSPQKYLLYMMLLPFVDEGWCVFS